MTAYPTLDNVKFTVAGKSYKKITSGEMLKFKIDFGTQKYDKVQVWVL